MNWQQKIKEWQQKKLLSSGQGQAIETYENGQQQVFRYLSGVWLGVFILCLGIVSLGIEYAHRIPEWIRLLIWGSMIIGGIVAGFYACQRGKKIMMESALFFTFLMIGGGIGLIAQIFNLPIGTGTGLMIWALVSFIVVLLSERALLALLWVPLFLGGILGYWHLELLLLFLADAPVASVCVSAGILLTIIFLTGRLSHPVSRAVYHWSIALFYGVLLIGENGIKQPMATFLVTIGFLGLLSWYAVHARKTFLFNLTVCLIALRFLFLGLELWHFSISSGWWLTGTGSLILLAMVGYRWAINRWEEKR